MCSSVERSDGLPENPAPDETPFPYPVCTAINFISSKATSALLRPDSGGSAALGVSAVSSATLLSPFVIHRNSSVLKARGMLVPSVRMARQLLFSVPRGKRMRSQALEDLFLEELQELYDAEKQIYKGLSVMARKATSVRPDRRVQDSPEGNQNADRSSGKELPHFGREAAAGVKLPESPA